MSNPEEPHFELQTWSPDDYPKIDQLPKSPKFVVIEDRTGPQPVIQVFFTFKAINHSDTVVAVAFKNGELRPGVTFLGAGLIDDNTAKWGSTTCKNIWEHDRPNDPEQAEQLINAINGLYTSHNK